VENGDVIDAKVVHKADPLEGLFKRCPRCGPLKELLAEFNRKFKSCVLRATRMDPQCDDRLDEKNVAFYGPFTVDCDDCSNRGFALTKRGERVVAFMKVYLDGADPGDLFNDNPIPF